MRIENEYIIKRNYYRYEIDTISERNYKRKIILGIRIAE